MYEAKQTGVPTVVHERPAAEPVQRLDLMTRLRRATDSGDFVLHWLPIIDLDTSRVCGVEALIRWHDGERGWLLPADFMAIAEETGLIDRIGIWVLTEAARQQRAWSDDGLDLEVAVNISARQLWMPNAAEAMLDVIRSAGADPSRMVFELTEASTARTAEGANRALRSLRDAGVRIAIDDFAHSPLSALQHMQVDMLKIDGPVLAAADQSAEGEMMLRAIVQLAHGLGIWPLAEGVETQRHHDILREAGCRFGQGFFFGQPMPADEVPAYAAPAASVTR
jgi:EAL domain-containing protein (putative c-di-GMP-specific phosphodiesterase class I)